MSIEPGTHQLGPDNGTLTVNTKRTGAAAKAGHDLLIHVESWNATLTIADDPSASTLSVDADGNSLQIVDGQGGISSLGDDDKKNIKKSIDGDVLKGKPIEFRSTSASGGDGKLTFTGDLTLVGKTEPITFDVTIADGKVAGEATIKQTDWKIKPYSALFGALKVADDVVVSIADCSL